MSWSIPRSRLRFALLPLLAVVSCSQPTPPEIEVSREDVVLAYVDDGVDTDVADCLVGLGSRDLDYGDMLPGETTSSDDPLIQEMLYSCSDAVAILAEDEAALQEDFDTGPFNIGDDAHLDRLWVGCAGGDGADCDSLWMEAPVGSAYESFGITCGNRLEILDCTTEMNEPDQDLDIIE